MASVIHTPVLAAPVPERRKTDPVRWLRLIAISVVLLTGCSAATTTTDVTQSADPADVVEPPTAAPTTEAPTAAPAEEEEEATEAAPAETETADNSANEAETADESSSSESDADPPQAEDEAEGQIDWADDLVPGVCFDEVEAEGLDYLVPGPPIDCAEPHQFEVFYQDDLADAAEWPGFDELANEAFASFCDDELVSFAGRPYDLLPLETFAWVPDEAEWNAGSRAAVCTVASLVAGASMVGTAAGSSLGPSSTDFMISMVRGTHGGLEIAIAGTDSEFASLTAQDLGLYDDALAFDGKRSLWFVADPDSDGSRVLMQYDLGTGEIVRVDVFDGRDVWNPTGGWNGTVIVSAGFAGSDDTELWTVGRTSATQLTNTPGLRVDSPAMPADRSHIVFSAQEAGVPGSNLWRFDFETLEATRLTEGSSNDTEPAMTPDGSGIVFTSDRSGNLDIWSIEPDGSNPTNLSNHPSRDSQPAYSLATDRVFFQSDRFGQTDNTMFMLRDGSEQASVTFEGVRSPEVMPAEIGVLAYLAAANNQWRFCDVPGGDASAECSFSGQELVSVTTNPEPAGAAWPGDEVLRERIGADCAAALDERFGSDREPREVFPVLITEEAWDFGTRITACMMPVDE